MRFLGDKRFESSIVQSILSEHKERLIITADATTGPANGPLPTSSTPAIKASLDKDRPSSKMKVGNGLTPLDLIFFEEYFSQVCDQKRIGPIFVDHFHLSFFLFLFGQT